MIEDVTESQRTVAEWLACAKSTQRAEPQPSKRSEVRYPWNMPMEMLASEHVHYVHCRDISSRGIGLICRIALCVDQRVYLRRDEQDPWVPCRVAHCTETVGANRVGVELHFDF